MSSSAATTELRHAPPPSLADEWTPAFRWVFPLLGAISLLGSCIISSLKRQLWPDEIFTHVEIGDPSLIHLFRTVPHIGGGGMPLFYLTAWTWARVFGNSDLSLRLYSSVGVCAAFLLLIAMMRRRFSARAAFLGVAFGMFSSLMVVDQNAEARAYGLYLLLATAAVAQALRIAETSRPSARDLALLVLSQAGLVLGHVLGLIYAALIVLALAVADGWQRQFRPKVYLCCMAGWLALIPWVPAILASMAVGQPHGWIPVPTFGSLLTGFSCWLFTALYWPAMQNAPAGLAIAFLCALACVVGVVWAAVLALQASSSARRPILLIGMALVLAPEAFFVVSRALQPVFLPRYMIPTAIGIAILCVVWAEQSRIGKGISAWNLSVVILLLPVMAAAISRPVRIDVAEIDQLAAGRPVVCDWLQDFMVVRRYTAHPALPQYPLDWLAALQGPRTAVTDFHLMQNYRRQGYWAANLRDASEVLNRKSFLLLDDADTNWFHTEIGNNPHYTWKLLAQLDDKRRILEVSRNPQP